MNWEIAGIVLFLVLCGLMCVGMMFGGRKRQKPEEPNANRPGAPSETKK